MSDGEEIVDLTSCVAEIVAAYYEAYTITERLKANRARHHAAPPPRVLDESIGQAPEEIQRAKENGVALIGRRYEEGDSRAIIALQRTTIRLQSSLLRGLRKAIDEDGAPIDVVNLVNSADSCRDQAIGALTGLEKRLLSARSSENGSFGDGRNGRLIHRSSLHREPVLKSSQESSPVRGIRPRSRRTWTREYSSSGDEDAGGGADEDQRFKGRARQASLLGFFRHHSNSNPVPFGTDKFRCSSAWPTSAPSKVQSPGEVKNEPIVEERHVVDARLIPERDEYLSPNWSASHPDGIPQRETLSAPPASNTQALSSPPTAPQSTVKSAGAILPRGRDSITVPQPNPENDYLGFCKGAWHLQTGDRKAMKACKEFNDGWSHATVYYLACSHNKCAFAGHIDLDVIWTKVWRMREDRGVTFRWPFLAKSHIMQSKVKDHSFVYQCLFCVSLGLQVPVLHGTDLYLDHIAKEHRGNPMSDVVLYKTGCINDRICDDSEAFDINLHPLSAQQNAGVERRQDSDALSDALLINAARNHLGWQETTFADEPWNEGLSEFHEGGEIERTERE